MAHTQLVHLEWDRGHEEFDAILRAESGDGIIVSEIHDLAVRQGRKWVPVDEIVSIEPLADDAPIARLASIRSYSFELIEVGLTRLPALLAHLASADETIGVYRAATGSDELLVGRIARLDESGFTLDLVSPVGAWEDEEHEYEHEDVISIEWGTDYLTGLRDLAGPR